MIYSSKILTAAVVFHRVAIPALKKQRASVSTVYCSSTGTKEMSTDQILSTVRNLSGRKYLSEIENQKLSLGEQLTKRW